jgi:hypothetical protein
MPTCYTNLKIQTEQVRAEYPGGINAWYHYVAKNLIYSQDAIDRHIEGKIVTRFIVDNTGHSHHFVSVSGTKEMSDEAIRLIGTTQNAP